MNVEVDTERALIGTAVAGDIASLGELESWVRGTLQSRVEEAGRRLDSIIERVPEVWSDRWSSPQFVVMLEKGRNDTNELADCLEKVAGLIQDIGPAIKQAESNLKDVAANAAEDGFEVNEDGVWYPEDPAQWDYDGNPVLLWKDLESQADAAIEPLATQIESMADSDVWASVLFTSGSIVTMGTDELLKNYESQHGVVLESSSKKSYFPLLDDLSPRTFGILKLATKVGGPIIDGLQVGYNLLQGKKPGQVLVEFGVGAGLLYGAQRASVASVGLLVAGSYFPAVGLGLAAAGAVYLAVMLPSSAGKYYVRNIAMDSRSRIAQSGGSNPYDESEEIVWDKGSYEHE